MEQNAGLELLGYIQEKDHFLREIGAELTLCAPGRAEICLDLERRHLSEVGRPHAHAGLLYTLAESASAAAVLPYGWNAYAVEGNISYIGKAETGKIRAVARAKDGHEAGTGSCRVTLYDEAGVPFAKASFGIYYTGEPFRP